MDIMHNNKINDWKSIQEKYDSGLSAREVAKNFGISVQAIWYASSKGILKLRTSKEATLLHKKKTVVSEETKKKMSEAKIKFLVKNPDKIPYLLNHSCKESYPEKCMREALINHNIIGWVSDYPYHIYRLDFAFPELKIDLEVDGSTHKIEDVIIKDNKRNKFLIDDGWLVIRIPALEVTRKIDQFIEKLKQIVEDRKTNVNSGLINVELTYQSKKFKPLINQCLQCHKLCKRCYCSRKCCATHKAKDKRATRPTLETLLQETRNTNFVQTGKKYGVSDNAIRKWIKQYQEALTTSEQVL